MTPGADPSVIASTVPPSGEVWSRNAGVERADILAKEARNANSTKPLCQNDLHRRFLRRSERSERRGNLKGYDGETRLHLHHDQRPAQYAVHRGHAQPAEASRAVIIGDGHLFLCLGATERANALRDRRTEVTDQQLDQLVYGLYSVTEEVSRIVEESTLT